MTRYKINDVVKTTVVCSGLIKFPDGWFAVTINPNSFGRVFMFILEMKPSPNVIMYQ